VTVLRIGIAKKLKICFICHENVDNIVVTLSIANILTNGFLIRSVSISECLNHAFFKDENLRLDAILGAQYDKTYLMQGYFCLPKAKDL